MQPEYDIRFQDKSGNLHVELSGDFNGFCAWALLKAIKGRKPGAGRVFVNTRGLGEVLPSGAELFRSHIPKGSLPRDWLYFKGRKGFQIAPDGARVLVCNKGRTCRKKDGPGKSTGFPMGPMRWKKNEPEPSQGRQS